MRAPSHVGCSECNLPKKLAPVQGNKERRNEQPTVKALPHFGNVCDNLDLQVSDEEDIVNACKVEIDLTGLEATCTCTECGLACGNFRVRIVWWGFARVPYRKFCELGWVF